MVLRRKAVVDRSIAAGNVVAELPIEIVVRNFQDNQFLPVGEDRHVTADVLLGISLGPGIGRNIEP